MSSLRESSDPISNEDRDFERRPSHRAAKISDKSIELTQDDPLERLKQLGTQGYYKYHFNWDMFQNGVMCELEITYLLTHQQSSRKTLIKEARFVKGTDLQYAKRVLAAVALERLGLGVETDDGTQEYDEAEAKMREVAEKSMGFAMSALNKLMSEIPSDHK
jgi:hypothetical protein